jgi:hypothetical protein
MWHHQLSAGIVALPVAPIHTIMAKMDKFFGFGDVNDRRANAAFWEKD